MTYDFLKPIAQKSLIDRIKKIDICVSDLDYTDATSPATAIVTDISHFFSKPGYIHWAIKTAFGKILNGQLADSKYWSEFIELFLRESSELDYIKCKFTEERIRKSLLPRVEEFYRNLPSKSYKVYITRNIKELADAYAKMLDLNLVIAEAFNKWKEVEKLFPEYGRYKNWLIKGDSEEDVEVLDFLKLKKRKHHIDDVVGIYVCGHSYNPNFDINIPQDYTGLVRAMKKFR